MTESTVMETILAELEVRGGLDLKGYRRSILDKRLQLRLSRLSLAHPSEYLDLLRSDPLEYERLIDTLSVRCSSFFRDPIVFETMAQIVIPVILERKRKAGSHEVRVWCAGCAEGEEAYSIAVLVNEAIKSDGHEWVAHIFATDVSRQAIQSAQRAFYTRERLIDVKLGILDKYFRPSGQGFEVLPFLRQMVRFSMDDILSRERHAPSESVFGAFDLVLCRNVLIYLLPEVQERVLQKLCRSLVNGGYLVLGSSESLGTGVQSRFMPLDLRNRIFCKAC